MMVHDCCDAAIALIYMGEKGQWLFEFRDDRTGIEIGYCPFCGEELEPARICDD